MNEKEFECMGCGIDTAAIGEYYMVTDKLWAKAARAHASIDDRGMLCIGCLEKAIGRTLTRSDFKNVPLNYMWPSQSARLRERLGFIGQLIESLATSH
jgi:hypothetical protein